MKSIFFISYIFLFFTCLSQPERGICMAQAADGLTKIEVTYDASYYSLSYPKGDLPANKGVCSDVIIRALRKCGIDLQQLVHKDMLANFDHYPNIWGLKKPDPNIDHRRVPNLMVYFERQGYKQNISMNSNDYRAGDLVCWDLGNGQYHIGIVSAVKTETSSPPLIIHNIGNGQVYEDFLFKRKIIGHYRYY